MSHMSNTFWVGAVFMENHSNPNDVQILEAASDTRNQLRCPLKTCQFTGNAQSITKQLSMCV